MIGNGVLFGFLTAFWALAFLEDQAMQMIYYLAFNSAMPFAWVLIFSSLIEFIRGDRQQPHVKVRQSSIKLKAVSSQFQVIKGTFTWAEA